MLDICLTLFYKLMLRANTSKVGIGAAKSASEQIGKNTSEYLSIARSVKNWTRGG